MNPYTDLKSKIEPIAELFDMDVGEIAYIYGSVYRPLSTMWVRIPDLAYGKDYIIFDSNGYGRYKSCIVSRTPLLRETIRSLGLSEIFVLVYSEEVAKAREDNNGWWWDQPALGLISQTFNTKEDAMEERENLIWTDLKLPLDM